MPRTDTTRGHSGLRQRGRHGGQADGARGLQNRLHHRIRWRGLQSATAWISRRCRSTARRPAPSPDFPAAKTWITTEAMFLECDVLLPAATENVITSQNADRCAAGFSAKAPTAPPLRVADEILADKKIFVIPDILANAGGVTVSYFEWVQDRQGFFWNEQLVNERLEEIMVDSFRRGGRLRRKTRREQPHGGLHAGARPRGRRHQAARDLRVTQCTCVTAIYRAATVRERSEAL